MRPRVPRPRVPVERERELVARFAVERAGFAALVARFAAGFFAAEERVEAAPADFARVEVLRVPAALRVPAGLRVPVDLAAALRPPDERALPVLRDADEVELEPALALPSTDHLPDMTRCAASATASAMIDPSLVALDTTLLAAACAESAASSPASRILRRAAGLALIAAAAAARPAASISLLIAAFASLSIVSLDRDEEPEEVVFEDLAIA